jgi:hypothetical protein
VQPQFRVFRVHPVASVSEAIFVPSCFVFCVLYWLYWLYLTSTQHVCVCRASAPRRTSGANSTEKRVLIRRVYVYYVSMCPHTAHICCQRQGGPQARTRQKRAREGIEIARVGPDPAAAAGIQFTGFTGTKVQILTQQMLQESTAVAHMCTLQVLCYILLYMCPRTTTAAYTLLLYIYTAQQRLRCARYKAYIYIIYIHRSHIYILYIHRSHIYIIYIHRSRLPSSCLSR